MKSFLMVAVLETACLMGLVGLAQGQDWGQPFQSQSPYQATVPHSTWSPEWRAASPANCAPRQPDVWHYHTHAWEPTRVQTQPQVQCYPQSRPVYCQPTYPQCYQPYYQQPYYPSGFQSWFCR